MEPIVLLHRLEDVILRSAVEFTCNESASSKKPRPEKSSILTKTVPFESAALKKPRSEKASKTVSFQDGTKEDPSSIVSKQSSGIAYGGQPKVLLRRLEKLKGHHLPVKFVKSHSAQKRLQPVPKQEITVANLYKCEFCGKNWRKVTEFNVHLRMHTGEKPFKCEICNKRFSQMGNKNTHERTHNPLNQNMIFKCYTCGRVFSKLCYLNVHKRTHIPLNHFKCFTCGRVFTKLCYLNVHKHVHVRKKSFKCQVNEKRFSLSSSSLILHKGSHVTHKQDKIFKCDTCGKGFSKLCYLNVHKRVHTVKKPVKCEIDHKAVSHLKTHRSAQNKMFNCAICHEQFYQIGKLKEHRSVHRGNVSWKCDTSNKKFSFSSMLKVHKRVHTGVKPFKCKVCGRAFSQFANLKVHLHVHTDDKPFRCEICEKRFSLLHNLKRHSILHQKEKTKKNLIENPSGTNSFNEEKKIE